MDTAEPQMDTAEPHVNDTAEPLEEIRQALRESLYEHASPISRRLAEVKGLHNNSIRRLERIETTLDSERNARIDDLALLVELLTEGWRSLNARLARIEQLLLAAQEPGAERPTGGEVYNLPRAEAS